MTNSSSAVATAPDPTAARGREGPDASSLTAGPDQNLLLCLSHLRWGFVYQRPQHLMSRFAGSMPVVYFEEPVAADGEPHLEERATAPGLTVAVPHLPPPECRPGDAAGAARMRAMLDNLLASRRVTQPLRWYYTPMALDFSDHLDGPLVVYDCMDELTGFRFAPDGLAARERQLLSVADIVFTGGRSLFEAKRANHDNVYAFPSGVDLDHFARAQNGKTDPEDMRAVAHPRIGYYGVIDERLDYPLIAAAAELRPEYQWVFVGPLAKVRELDLPQAANLHYLGPKSYTELPDYLAGWDVAMMPFALNDATTYISPTKTPEYLAGGKPVVSTPIGDVVRTYGNSCPVPGLVRIGADASAFVAAVDAWLDKPESAIRFAERAAPLLAPMSWDRTFSDMVGRMNEAVLARGGAVPRRSAEALVAATVVAAL